jgi:cytochrome c oxidase assembly factor CtaG
MIYLFVTSLVPTVPGAWLVFAEGAVYKAYDIPNRLFGISVTTDQQVAGVIMKLGAGTYLWVLITLIFFRWSAANQEADRQAALARRREVLTFQAVAAEFEKHPPPPVEQPHP